MRRFLTIVFLSAITSLSAQDKPKLVVGIVVDQMRMDYIYRYWDKYGDEGFKRLMSDGHVCKNAHFNYVPTYTGPGHASIFSGTTPMNHGIIANNWYDREASALIYCVSDDGVSSVGTSNESGKRSPHLLKAPTLGDAIRISNGFQGKTIGISLKDRSAILPVGYSANAAYWMDYETGDFVSSSYYMDELPKWVKTFNNQNHPDQLMKDGWHTMLSIEKYTESTADDTPYEKVLSPSGKPVFPYDLAEMVKKENYYLFAVSPFGSTVLRKLADQVVINEDLGDDEHTDLLTISFSSPDMAGHAFGPQSIEIEDTYLRLDAEIAQLLVMLDNRVGSGNYTLFLTADHAAAQVTSYLQDHNMPMDYFDSDAFRDLLRNHLQEVYGDSGILESYSNQQVFLNYAVLKELSIDPKKVMDDLVDLSLTVDGISGAYSSKDLRHPLPDNQFAHMAQMGWCAKRSGDVVIQYETGWMVYGHQGTTHGSSYNYDSHVPILLYGFGIQPGITVSEVDITQLVPTISIITSTAFPMQSEHRPIEAAIKQ